MERLTPTRCPWTGDDPLMIEYHDKEWGVPLHDEQKTFEFLVLEGMQAGLSWRTILHKREGFCRAFAGFDPQRVARFNARSIERLMQDKGIVRNRQKIEAAVNNAKRFIEVQHEFGSFSDYAWSFVDREPIQHRYRSMSQVPATSRESEQWSRDLKRRGFRFVGPTVCYAHMQATGMVNDHLTGCHRYKTIKALAR